MPANAGIPLTVCMETNKKAGPPSFRWGDGSQGVLTGQPTLRGWKMQYILRTFPSFRLPGIGSAEGNEESIAGAECLSGAFVIRECDRAFQQVHQLVAREVDEFAVVAGGLPDADGKLAGFVLKEFVGVLKGYGRVQHFR